MAIRNGGLRYIADEDIVYSLLKDKGAKAQLGSSVPILNIKDVRKNWKLKFVNEHYIDIDQLPAKVICIKVDYAEATGTHNTQNANFVETLYDEKVPAQLDEPKVRTAIYGKPILLFHQKTESDTPVFYGKMSAVVKLSLIHGGTPGMDNAFEG